MKLNFARKRLSRSTIFLSSVWLVSCSTPFVAHRPYMFKIRRDIPTQNLRVKEYKNSSATDYSNFVKQKLSTIDSLFNPPDDPYFGHRNPGPTCSKSKLPAMQRYFSATSQEQVISLFATNEYVYGACSDQLDTLKSQLIWLYCSKSRRFFEIRFFYPKERPWFSGKMVECQDDSTQ